MTAWGQPDLFTRRIRQLPPALEFETQCAIAKTLRIGAAPGWLWTHFPAGEERSKNAGARLKSAGLNPGWPDLILVSPACDYFWLELKRGRASLSEAQEAWHEQMLARGANCAVARSYGEAMGQLKEWGAVRTTVTA